MEDRSRAVELGPRLTAAHHRGHAYRDLGDLERAVQDSDSAIEIEAGDRGHFVRALQQRLTRGRGLGFLDPGRYYDVYDTATREAVIRIQQQADLEPTGVVDGATWDALEAAGQQPEPVEEPPDRVDPAHPPAHNRAGAPLAYLTFDDGPHPMWTPQVLDLLSSYDVTATFFVLGSAVSRFPQIIERMVDAGHEAENHTFDHIWLSKADREDIVSQVTSTDDALHEVAGSRVDPIECLRPPARGDECRMSDAELVGLRVSCSPCHHLRSSPAEARRS